MSKLEKVKEWCGKVEGPFDEDFFELECDWVRLLLKDREQFVSAVELAIGRLKAESQARMALLMVLAESNERWGLGERSAGTRRGSGESAG